MSLEGNCDGAGRAVTLLCEDQISLTLSRVFLPELSVQQNHHVGVLLQRAGLTQVTHVRFLVGALL